MADIEITVDGGTQKRLMTAGKYCDRDILVTATGEVAVPGIDQNTLLMIHGDSLVDSSFEGIQLEVTGVQITDEKTRFDKPVLKFDGTAYIKAQAPMFVLQDSDYTVDWWEYRQGGGTFVAINAFPPGYAGLVFIGSTNLYASSVGNGWDALNGLSIGVPAAQYLWMHQAIVKKGNTITIYINGSKVAESAITGGMYAGDGIVYIGSRDPDLGDIFTGYATEVRISNVARWDAEFTPPSAPYTEDKASLYLSYLDIITGGAT